MMEADHVACCNPDLDFSTGRFKFRPDPDGLRRAPWRRIG
jgi:hypothetical protein